MHHQVKESKASRQYPYGLALHVHVVLGDELGVGGLIERNRNR